MLTGKNIGPFFLFYTFIYYDRYFFDYGHISRLPINKTAYMLLGFNVTVVTVTD